MWRFLTKRFKAFALDYLIIIIYIILLFTLTLILAKVFALSLENVSLPIAQFIGFSTLTAPVIFYFTISESGQFRGTFGKRKFKLQVVSQDLSKATFAQLLFRNLLKFLPWEMAHFFVFRLQVFVRGNLAAPDWIYFGLLASQALALLYLVMLFFHRNRSLYELLSSTTVIENGVNS